MNKSKLANGLAFFIGIYFIVRAIVFYNKEDMKLAMIYFFAGILAIGIQVVVIYLKKKKEKTDD